MDKCVFPSLNTQFQSMLCQRNCLLLCPNIARLLCPYQLFLADCYLADSGHKFLSVKLTYKRLAVCIRRHFARSITRSFRRFNIVLIFFRALKVACLLILSDCQIIIAFGQWCKSLQIKNFIARRLFGFRRLNPIPPFLISRFGRNSLSTFGYSRSVSLFPEGGN